MKPNWEAARKAAVALNQTLNDAWLEDATNPNATKKYIDRAQSAVTDITRALNLNVPRSS